MPLIYLIRHAQASFGSDHYDRLSALGMRQAEILGEYFAKEGLEFHTVYSGPMERLFETAQRTVSRANDRASEHQVVIAPEFNEYDAHGIIRFFAPTLAREDPAFAEAFLNVFTDPQALELVFERAMLRWISGRHPVPDTEPWPAFNLRVHTGLERLARDAGPTGRFAIVTSAGAICSIVQNALGLSDEQIIRLAMQVRNTSVSTIRYDGNRPTLISFDSVAHLEVQNRPELLTYR